MANTSMYAIDRSEEYLAHYGIKGMKWGVRKAIESGNTKKLDRQYRKAQKKLAKLKARANNGSKYAKRAAALGAAGAAVGGMALAGASRIGRGVEALGTLARSTRNKNIRTAGQGVALAGDTLNRWSQSNSIAKKAGNMVADTVSRKQINALKNSRSVQNVVSHITEDQARKMYAAGNTAGIARLREQAASHLTDDQAHKIWDSNRAAAKKTTSGISNNTVARVGAGAISAGLLGAAGYNAYRAATTKRAAKKAAEFESEMNKAFSGTKYANRTASPRKRRRR